MKSILSRPENSEQLLEAIINKPEQLLESIREYPEWVKESLQLRCKEIHYAVDTFCEHVDEILECEKTLEEINPKQKNDKLDKKAAKSTQRRDLLLAALGSVFSSLKHAR